MVRRIPSGIPGLDKLIEGGFVDGSVNLITGGTGTGKTLFACQFIWAGLQKGESGIYITLEERPEDIKADALQFDWDFEKFEKRGLCKIIYYDPIQLSTTGASLIEDIAKLKANRIVIDSTSLFGIALKDPAQIRRRIYNLILALKKAGCVTLLISEIPEGSSTLSRFGVEEFVVDSVIVLRAVSMGKAGMERTLEVRKMRRTSHDEGIHSFDFGKAGIRILD
jgi:circadian clock protein KaiC